LAEEVEAEIEEEEEECPKCPPVGAPAWMATFADMATLLMAFFVLILSFAEFNVPKFKQISGSLKNAFGVQRLIPVVEQPKGTTVLSLNFSPSPSPSVTRQMTQQTTNLEKKELEVKTKEDEGGEQDKSAKELVEALQEAVDKGEIKVEAVGEAVKVEINDQDTAAKDLPKLIQETLEAIEEAKNKTGNTDQEVLFGGLEEKLKELASLAQTEAEGDTKGSSIDSGSGVDDSEKSSKEASADQAANELELALKNEIDKGLVSVERKDGKVFVTVGSGGAFSSGSAELTSQARQIMGKIADKGVGETGTVTVSGHTDNVPLMFGGNFRDNWDLAAARASSVVQELEKAGSISTDRMKAVSFGESKPLDTNETSAGREKNRRIEIEINF
jgi:chemotaxis protein MotB